MIGKFVTANNVAVQATIPTIAGAPRIGGLATVNGNAAITAIRTIAGAPSDGTPAVAALAAQLIITPSAGEPRVGKPAVALFADSVTRETTSASTGAPSVGGCTARLFAPSTCVCANAPAPSVSGGVTARLVAGQERASAPAHLGRWLAAAPLSAKQCRRP